MDLCISCVPCYESSKDFGYYYHLKNIIVRHSHSGFVMELGLFSSSCNGPANSRPPFTFWVWATPGKHMYFSVQNDCIIKQWWSDAHVKSLDILQPYLVSQVIIFGTSIF